MSLDIKHIFSFSTSNTLDKLKNVANKLKIIGGIDDIVSIVDTFFKIPLNKININDILLEEKDKKIDLKTGKISTYGVNVSELSDNPILDITKLIDFSSLGDLSNLKKIQFSISTPGILIHKPMNFGVKDVDIAFHIHTEGFSWLPLFDTLNSTEEALERIKMFSERGYKINIPLELKKENTNKIKNLLIEQYSEDIINPIFNESDDPLILFNKLAEKGIYIQEKVDCLTLIKKELEKQSIIISDNIIDDDRECGIKIDDKINQSAFRSEEVREIEKDCCGEDLEKDVKEVFQENENIVIEKLTDTNDLTDEEEDVIVNDALSFINECEKCASSIETASNEKMNAMHNWYCYTEAYLLNDIANEYLGSRSETIDILLNDVSSLIQERHSIIDRQVYLNKERSTLIIGKFKKISKSVSDDDYIYEIDNFKIREDDFDKMLKDTNFKNSLNIINNEFFENENKIKELSGKIQVMKTSYGIPSLSTSELFSIKTYGISSIIDRIKDRKKIFRTHNNPISNQIGFGGSCEPVILEENIIGTKVLENIEDLHIFLDPCIFDEAKMIFLMSDDPVGDAHNYICVLNKRDKKYGEIWNKYYSANQIDNLFSFKEQGFLSPKPLYDDSGNEVGLKTSTTISDSLKNSIEIDVSDSLKNIEIDQDISIEFWTGEDSGTVKGSGYDINEKIKIRMLSLLEEVKNSDTYKNYIENIRRSGREEAQLIYAANLTYEENSYDTLTYMTRKNVYEYEMGSSFKDSYLNTSELAKKYRERYYSTYNAINNFKKNIQDKLEQLESFIINKENDIAEGEECFLRSTKSFSDKCNLLNEKIIKGSLPKSSNKRTNCEDKLGSDPLGLYAPLDCPDFKKNCYWKEYTKIMQQVSLMPVPDIDFLNKRLFRYYPVGIRFPVISPTGVLPTLALGIPDNNISIPVPIFWKHITTLNTPLGTFVIWIALTGFIPCPYVLYIDEKMDACFLVTLKGKTDIPKGSLNIQDSKSIIDIIKPINEFLRVDLNKKPWNYLYGDSKLNLSDCDDKSIIINKILEKITNSINSVKDDTWSLLGIGKDGSFKERLRNSFESFPPDMQIIEQAFNLIYKKIEEQINKINISSVKFPKDPNKLSKPILGPLEAEDTINKLREQGLSNSDLGSAPKFISVRTEMEKLINKKLLSSEVLEEFKNIDKDIIKLEKEIISEELEEKIKRRIKIIRRIILIPINMIANNISPGMLGYSVEVKDTIVRPTPCYEDREIEPLPSYILDIVNIITGIPNIINTLSDEVLMKALKIDIKLPLSLVADMSWYIFDSILNFIPDIKYPDDKTINIYKQVLKMNIQDAFKLKIRMPRIKIDQAEISGTFIKNIIRKSILRLTEELINELIYELDNAINYKDINKIKEIEILIVELFGTDLNDIRTREIKAFLMTMLIFSHSSLNSINYKTFPIEKYKSIREKLFKSSSREHDEKTYMNLLSLRDLEEITMPMLQLLKKDQISFITILLGCSSNVTRKIISSMYPYSAIEILPPWEKISIKNIPFIIWLDQLIATAQRTGGVGCSYVKPYNK